MKHIHYYVETGIPHPLVFLNSKFRYDCSVCNKQKYFRTAPVNPTVPSAWKVYENSDKEYSMSPSILLGNEPDYIIGERYKRLLNK